MTLSNKLTISAIVLISVALILSLMAPNQLNTLPVSTTNSEQATQLQKSSAALLSEGSKNSNSFTAPNQPSNLTTIHSELQGSESNDSSTTLAGKIQIEEEIRKKIMGDGNTAQHKTETMEDINSTKLELFKDLFEYSGEKRWDDFSHTVASLEEFNSETLHIALFQAIVDGAPIEVITALISRGAVIMPEALSILAQQNNVRLTKQLIPLGLDIHQKDGFYKTGIQNTLEFFKSRQMFDFLLANGVTVNTPASQGRDALDLALMRLLENNDGLYYAMKLLEHGAVVANSHRELFTQLKTDKPQAYQALSYYIR